MSLHAVIFPAESRPLPGKRWIDIALRSLHLVGLLGVGGEVLYGAGLEMVTPWIWLTVVSGVGMVVVSLISNGVWLMELRGITILIKVAMLSLIPLSPGLGVPLLIAVTLLSGVIAHAPGAIRYYRPFGSEQ